MSVDVLRPLDQEHRALHDPLHHPTKRQLRLFQDDMEMIGHDG
jgi:hypothetical protein